MGVLDTQTNLMASVKLQGNAVSAVDPVLALCTDIIERLPPLFNMHAVTEKYPIVYTNSMNTVLRQELIRYGNYICFTEAQRNILHCSTGSTGFYSSYATL